MFKINNSKAFLQLTAIFFAICDFTLGVERKCAEYNEYCQEHWECCSNTCLTYSYRCIGRNHPAPTFDRPTWTLEELLNSMTEGDTISSTTHSQPPSGSSENSQYTQNKLFDVRNESGLLSAEPILRGRSAAVEEKSVFVVNPKEPGFIFFVLQPRELQQQSKQLTQQAQSAHDEPTGQVSIVKTTDKIEIKDVSEMEQNPVIQCKEIGEKCNRDKDCCSQRCHGFLHQCVT